MFDFGCRQKGTGKGVLHLVCEAPSLLLLAELYLHTTCNPCALDDAVKVCFQYIPLVYVSSRKLMWAWEKRTILKQLASIDVDGFDVFSEFDCDRDLERQSNGSLVQSSHGGSQSNIFKASSRSFQYTHNFSLPKTQTHKKFLAVFKSSRPESIKSNNQSNILGASAEKDQTDGRFSSQTILARDVGASVKLAGKRPTSGRSIKMPTASIQRIVRGQRDQKSFLESPRSTMNHFKHRKLGSVISSLKFEDRSFQKSIGTSKSKSKADQLEEINQCIQEKVIRICDMQKKLIANQVSMK